MGQILKSAPTLLIELALIISFKRLFQTVVQQMKKLYKLYTSSKNFVTVDGSRSQYGA